jgi:pilus assembly protein CpaF
MLQMSGLALPTVAMRQQMAQALDVVIQTARLSDGSRKLVSVSEVVGMEAETIQLQELFTFHRDGVGEDGSVTGRFVSTGFRPHFADRLKATSRHVDLGVFNPTDS